MVCVAGQDGVLQVKRVLIIKTSSMGDVVHTLPALTDAVRAMPGVTFDWVVEEGLAEVPRWHPSVDRVLKVAIRRWRRSWWSGETRGERRRFRAELREREYDAVIDAQGLIKSAWLSMQARGRRHGLSWGSAREGISSLACHERHAVARSQHAILRVRQLFAASLGYGLGATEPDYGIDRNRLAEGALSRASVVLLHGTTWETKHWPEAYWLALAKQAGAAGFEVLMPWGNDRERNRAARIASGLSLIHI
jgi:heptosyltransferase-1